MTRPLIDPHGRVHRDLRVSLTDKCNLRCTYCMPAEGLPWLPKDELLTTPELLTLVEAAVTAGITEVRLTGGEPLVRPDVVEIVAGIAAMEGPQGRPEVSMTTNGLGLAKIAPALKEAGLARVNVSLDTLHPERFHEITRRDRFDDVVAGMAAAHEAGLRPVKVNSVLQRGINDDEVVDLTRWAVERGYELRFIEQMPLDAQHSWERTEMITGHEILASLRAELDLEELPGRGAAPAERFLIDGGPATVGVVASVTMPFCGSCDRLRLTADGQLRNCLFANGETDLRGPLRSGATEEEIHALVHECLALKLPGHGINEPGFLQPPRPMSAIGG
ncbi:GTP 3',8-cyclase MoaA [Janibacter indicus]|uniref:GTP 3',8-cyclase n=1 Tax=Janibacter indicus TaxID=857417 RepID=A0A1L3MLA8_9MICO|nr:MULTISPECIES: GTP 3',8-cyclase MoaA [Janibacter]APH03142.1 cyclic pyranopterin phosphate synthase MoaA [Janibacter indicus]QNF93242.1 GTP 3',8-cyclase MoaA [Janibacter sp. YB324]QOK21841.1 GTP 3',8-cyclase MoaA [Janibacter indicus]